MLVLVLLLSKILIIMSVVGLARCSSKFRRISSELDQQVLTALKRIMHVTTDQGYPSQFIPVLILLTVLTFLLSSYVTGAAVR
jgi:hypothetical protein